LKSGSPEEEIQNWRERRAGILSERKVEGRHIAKETETTACSDDGK